MSNRKTHEDFVRELMAKHPHIEVLERYENSATRILVKCKKCGREWSPIPTKLLHGKGCATCNGANRKTTEQFVSELKEINSTIKVVGEYESTETPIECECRKCGHHWSARPGNLLRGTGCPMCAHPSFKKTHEQFVADLHEVNPDIDVLGKYEGIKNKIDVACRVCGHKWHPNAGSILQGRGCPKCRRAQAARKNMVTDEEFRRRLTDLDVKVTPLEEYKGNAKPILVRCDVCGHEWRPTPGTLYQGEGCPSCAHGQTSYMEQFLAETLRFALGDDAVVSRNRDTIGSELDIFIPSLNVAIEPGGWYWHAGKVREDATKRDIAEEAGIRVITIYDSFPTIEVPPFDKDCITSKYDLGSARNKEHLQAVALELLNMIGATTKLSTADWKHISIQAHEAARRKTPEQFEAELAAVSPDIELTSQYLSSGRKVGCRCLKCGHEWSATANNLLRGSGCPVCSHARGSEKIRKDNAWFLEQLALFNPGVEPLEEYLTQKSKVLCRCKQCSHEWRATPRHLIRGHGCPECAKRATSERRKKSPEQFAKELADANPDIQLVGCYEGSSIPVRVKCKKCGHEWSPIPNNILRGAGCPICSRKKVAEKQTKASPEQIEKIISAIKSGMTVRDACASNGISKATYYRYLKTQNHSETCF